MKSAQNQDDSVSAVTGAADASPRVLVVDGANVVGSVPDGWWRDRAGAASRLHAGLVQANLPFDVVELVLEGQAKKGVPAGVEGPVTTIHAPGEGDDEIVERCRRHAESGAAVTAATADRGLIGRLEPYGVTILGPSSVRAHAVPHGRTFRGQGPRR